MAPHFSLHPAKSDRDNMCLARWSAQTVLSNLDVKDLKGIVLSEQLWNWFWEWESIGTIFRFWQNKSPDLRSCYRYIINLIVLIQRQRSRQKMEKPRLEIRFRLLPFRWYLEISYYNWSPDNSDQFPWEKMAALETGFYGIVLNWGPSHLHLLPFTGPLPSPKSPGISCSRADNPLEPHVNIQVTVCPLGNWSVSFILK